MNAEEFGRRLAGYAELTRQAMQRFLAPDPATRPETDDTSRYLYDLVRDYPERGGKGLRPALLLAGCEAMGGRTGDALPAAVALELVHNAFLVHDDIEDSSPLRRGRPTLHAEHGLPLALNAGDALALLAFRPLAELTGRRSRELLDELGRAVRLTTEGQAIELGWRRDAVEVPEERYFDLVGSKTCWYTTVAPLRMGAVIAGRPALLGPLSRFGFLLGTAFQIRDDLLDLTDDPGTGKQPYGDLREGKQTLPLMHLRSRAQGVDRDWLRAVLAPGRVRTSDDVSRIVALMQAYGSISYAAAAAGRVQTAAQQAYLTAVSGLPASPALDFLAAATGFVVERDS